MEVVEGGEDAGGVILQCLRPAGLGHLGRTPEHPPCVEAEETRRHEADRAQHGKAPADVRWNRERPDLLRLGELAEGPPLRVGDQDQVILPGVAQARREPRAYDQHLRDGLDRAAGLGDHDDQGLFGVEAVEERAQQPRVAVVRQVEAATGVGRELGRAAEGVEHGARAEGGAADPEDDDLAERCGDAPSPRLDLFDRLGVRGEPPEAELPFVHAAHRLRARLSEGLGEGLETGVVRGVRRSHGGGGGEGVVDHGALGHGARA